MPGALTLDHLQPVKLILSQKISNLSAFILGWGANSYCLRERERERERERKAENEKLEISQLE